MADRDDFTYIEGYQVSPHIRRKPSRQPETFFHPCAFCDGTGIYPDNVRNIDCTACDGEGSIELVGNESDYRPCVICDGTGHEPHTVRNVPCHKCHGAGIIL